MQQHMSLRYFRSFQRTSLLRQRQSLLITIEHHEEYQVHRLPSSMFQWPDFRSPKANRFDETFPLRFTSTHLNRRRCNWNWRRQRILMRTIHRWRHRLFGRHSLTTKTFDPLIVGLGGNQSDRTNISTKCLVLLRFFESIHFLVVEVSLYFVVLIVLILFSSLSIVHCIPVPVFPNHWRPMRRFLKGKSKFIRSVVDRLSNLTRRWSMMHHFSLVEKNLLEQEFSLFVFHRRFQSLNKTRRRKMKTPWMRQRFPQAINHPFLGFLESPSKRWRISNEFHQRLSSSLSYLVWPIIEFSFQYLSNVFHNLVNSNHRCIFSKLIFLVRLRSWKWIF